VSPRARALALLGAAAVCAGAAASIVNRYSSRVRAQVGPPVRVLLADRAIPRGKLITARDARLYMRAGEVPERFAQPDALRYGEETIGLRAAGDIPAGTHLTSAQFAARRAGSAADRSSGDRRRLVEIRIAGASALSGFLQPGARVDVLITSARGSGPQRTYLALQRIELASFVPVADPGAAGADTGAGTQGAAGTAAVRVTLRQAVLLTAAQNFAGEVRLVPRAAGDDRLFKPTAVSAADLQQ
jgi:pilus assembly protein CpaB